jgi:NAD(P)H-hydrate repair Nnr-like enzyme with NAD(P)H-hydrate dehydratase domain
MEYVFVHTAKQLERDLTEAREIIAAALRALPVGYLPAHTPESIPARIEDLCQTIVETERELAEAREQRDTLAEALDELIITEGRGLDQWERDAFAKAKQAIAAVKGGEP